MAVTELGPKAHQPYFPKFQGGAEHPSARRAAEPAGTAQARQRSGAPRAPGMPCRTTGGCLRPRRSAALAAGARLRVVAELVVEALPGALVGVCDGDVAGVRQPLQPLAHERDAALEQRQHRVAKVEALLRAARRVRRPRGRPPRGRAGGNAPQQPHAHATGLSAACMSATRSCSARIRPARSQCSVSMSAMCVRTVVSLHARNGPPCAARQRARRVWGAARLQRVDVKDDDAGGPAARERDAGQDARQRNRRRDVALRLHLRRGAAPRPQRTCGTTKPPLHILAEAQSADAQPGFRAARCALRSVTHAAAGVS